MAPGRFTSADEDLGGEQDTGDDVPFDDTPAPESIRLFHLLQQVAQGRHAAPSQQPRPVVGAVLEEVSERLPRDVQAVLIFPVDAPTADFLVVSSGAELHRDPAVPDVVWIRCDVLEEPRDDVLRIRLEPGYSREDGCTVVDVRRCQVML